MNSENLKKLARLVRYYILTATTAAGSGHPTSSLSATELMTTLMFGGFFKANLEDPNYTNNDRLIFSKGHAAPLLYSLYSVAGKVSADELLTLRKFNSRLEGHPTMHFPYTEAATGSLGQGLSIGVGMALNAKTEKLPYKTFVLLGDGEMAEGSNWEAIQIAAHYKLDNLIAIVDVSGLEQAGDSMMWHSRSNHGAKEHAKRFEAFGWKTIRINGHDFSATQKAYQKALKIKGAPVAIIAETVKGKGVKLVEGKNNWHGKALSKEECEKAIKELGKIDFAAPRTVAAPSMVKARQPQTNKNFKIENPNYKLGEMVAVRKAFGSALVKLGKALPEVVVLDAGVSNSTHTDLFKKAYPKRFFEMFIAEQNMVGTALGLSRRGKIPFVSTFAAFFTRAHDQIRMSQYSKSNLSTTLEAGIKFVGSHVGVSIGEDGPSQMGLEDIALFRSVQGCLVLYPCDAMSTEKLVARMAEHAGNVYMRTTRQDTLTIYRPDEEFAIGGSKVLHKSARDVVTIVAAGITVFEALAAYTILQKENIFVRVIDLYSIKPVDAETLVRASRETKAIVVVEDHYREGGMHSAVVEALVEQPEVARIYSLAITKMPRSGAMHELLSYETIDKNAIIKLIKSII